MLLTEVCVCVCSFVKRVQSRITMPAETHRRHDHLIQLMQTVILFFSLSLLLRAMTSFAICDLVSFVLLFLLIATGNSGFSPSFCTWEDNIVGKLDIYAFAVYPLTRSTMRSINKFLKRKKKT